MFTLTSLLASWLSLLGLLAGQPGLAGFGVGLSLLLIAGKLVRSGRRRARHTDASARPGRPALQSVRPLDQDLLRGAIRLCHPDLHPPERSELATTVTSRLLELERAGQGRRDA
jgi:hypothetical protein